MLDDVVIDTDVLMHADNPEYFDYDEARAFVEEMRSCQTCICIDESDQGAIAQEYLDRLPPGSLGGVLLREAADDARIRFVSRKVPSAVINLIRQCVHDKSDHKWLRVAYNSREKIVTSHNTKHLHPQRTRIAKRIGVEVLTAGECRTRL